MATVEKDPTRRKTPYVVRWRDEAGKQRKRGFGRKVDADRFRAEVEHKLHSGTYIDPAAGRTTFEAYAERWRAMQPHRPNTAARTRSQLTHHVYPALGARQLAQIRASELQAFVTGLPLSPGSVRPLWATVRAILSAAVRDRLIPYDPCDRIKLPELPRKQITPLTVEQVDQLAGATPPRYRALVVVGAATGLRQGELFGVQVADVDFLRRTLTVERQVQPGPGGAVEPGPLKNRSSYRTLPVGRVVVDALAAHLEAYPAGRDAYVFRDDDGRPLHRNRFNRDVWAPARAAAGLPDATCHDLRHFYASVLIGAGHNPKAVADRLGHANAAMTLNVYSHMWPSDEDRTRQAIDDVFRRSA
ncbi:tyrosine-type recombinase/integrase [Micromonospora coerulea]|uniref:tyrosine-type recombinase/integrase n=1 Tax=Micromonospora coerulea TaxID=47856 RepID=UPI0019035A19|nr:site-specific integrase [Micromonospora veneta]